MAFFGRIPFTTQYVPGDARYPMTLKEEDFLWLAYNVRKPTSTFSATNFSNGLFSLMGITAAALQDFSGSTITLGNNNSRKAKYHPKNIIGNGAYIFASNSNGYCAIDFSDYVIDGIFFRPRVYCQVGVTGNEGGYIPPNSILYGQSTVVGFVKLIDMTHSSAIEIGSIPLMSTAVAVAAGQIIFSKTYDDMKVINTSDTTVTIGIYQAKVTSITEVYLENEKCPNFTTSDVDITITLPPNAKPGTFYLNSTIEGWFSTKGNYFL